MKQRKRAINRISPIKYSYSSYPVCPPPDDGFRSLPMKFSMKPCTSSLLPTSHEVFLLLSSFLEPSTCLLQIQNKWFVNLSSVQIPPEVQGLLQLGYNFCLPVMNKKHVTMEFIKYVENNIRKLPTKFRTIFRDRATPLIKKFTH